jgi:NAD(P)-dependent dehydrogenase (short-subunit alcohol dehydrogenase family)
MAQQDQIDRLRDEVKAAHGKIHGLVHSLAFADYSAGWLPFHQTPRSAFLQAVDISCFSLVALANAFRDSIDRDAGSVVAISISTTRMAAENYGYMAPIKAALDSSICFLAKSFSQFSNVRFNAVCPGLLKSSASAGIPGYVESYLYAEQATLRKRAVETSEVASAVAFQRPGAGDRRRHGDQLFRQGSGASEARRVVKSSTIVAFRSAKERRFCGVDFNPLDLCNRQPQRGAIRKPRAQRSGALGNRSFIRPEP